MSDSSSFEVKIKSCLIKGSIHYHEIVGICRRAVEHWLKNALFGHFHPRLALKIAWSLFQNLSAKFVEAPCYRKKHIRFEITNILMQVSYRARKQYERSKHFIQTISADLLGMFVFEDRI